MGEELQVLSVPSWAWLVVVGALFVAYLVSIENGAVLAEHAHRLHELFHDGRHFMAMPCH